MELVWMVVGWLVVAVTLPVLLEMSLFLAAPIGPKRTSASAAAPGPGLRLAVLIPAHNEEGGIEDCVQSVLASDAGDHRVQVVVIADNCTDRTAPCAQQAGARVLVRTDASRQGKGAALEFAMAQLAPEAWDAYLIVDADTVVAADFCRTMGDSLGQGHAAVQCRYLVDQTASHRRSRLMNLALLSMNVFRPAGRDRWGLSAGIFGNGFGLSRSTIEAVPYKANSITEDLEYHLSLIQQGLRVHFVSQTEVRARFPENEQGAKSQRARWEGGRFRLQRTMGPRLLIQCLGGRGRFVEPFLELMSLPLSYALVLLTALCFVPGWLGYGVVGLAILILHLVATLILYGSRQDWLALGSIPGYLLWKLIQVPSILWASRSKAPWVRTNRDRRSSSGRN